MTASKQPKSPSLKNRFDQLQTSYRVREEENRIFRNKISTLEGDNRKPQYLNEILQNDVTGYKSEVTRLKDVVLHLQAQIGRICIEKGIVR